MGFSPRNLSCSLPTDPHSPHACSTPGVYTFSVTWIVLRLLSSLALGYNNRPDRKSPGFVAATGFLPGVLSFPCALSHLERIAHRPPSHTQSSTAWSQQPMGKIDTGFPNWFSNHRMDSRPRLRNGDLTHRLDLGQWMHMDSPDTTQDFSVQTEVKPTLSESITGFWFSMEVYTGFLRARHRLFGSQGCMKVLCRTWVSRTAQSPYTLRQSDRMGEGDPSHNSPWPFYSHAPGLTLVALGTACVPPARITFPWSGT
jgi:hypothetical protein